MGSSIPFGVLLLLLGHLAFGHNLLCISCQHRTLHPCKETFGLGMLLLTRGSRVKSLLLLDEFALNEFHELILMLLKVPAYGDAHDLLPRSVLDPLLKLLLHWLCAIHQRQVAHSGSVVLVGGVLHVHLLENAQLTDTKGQTAQEGEDVSAHHKVDLRPHQALLCLEAPGNENAVLSRRLSPSSSEDQQSIVHRKCKNQPSQADCKRPHDEEELEIEVELHSNAGHRRLQEVGVQRVKVPSFVGAELLGHSHLGTRARIKCALEPLSVDNGTSSNVDNPADNEQGHKAKHCKERIPVVRVGALTLSSRAELKTRLAGSASILTFRRAGLAAVDDAGAADATLGIRDRLFGVHGRARLRSCFHALEVAVNTICTVIGIDWALLWALQELVVTGAHDLLFVTSWRL
mmetsp:Transcript_73439/g.172230  ORF Transcript_73439/g.172230 Transcript_73439/m.172230 type:complete len:404 (+) Transcript_73439:1893-3104(+)